MKNFVTIAFSIFLFLSGITYAQTTTTPASPSEPATTQPDQQSPAKTDFNSTPTSVPKTGNPSEDTLIRGQKKPGVKSNDDAMDKGKNKGSMQKGKKNKSSQPDTTGGSAVNPRTNRDD